MERETSPSGPSSESRGSVREGRGEYDRSSSVEKASMRLFENRGNDEDMFERDVEEMMHIVRHTTPHFQDDANPYFQRALEHKTRSQLSQKQALDAQIRIKERERMEQQLKIERQNAIFDEQERERSRLEHEQAKERLSRRRNSKEIALMEKATLPAAFRTSWKLTEQAAKAAEAKAAAARGPPPPPTPMSLSSQFIDQNDGDELETSSRLIPEGVEIFQDFDDDFEAEQEIEGFGSVELAFKPLGKPRSGGPGLSFQVYWAYSPNTQQ
jgi:hypothetical protein